MFLWKQLYCVITKMIMSDFSGLEVTRQMRRTTNSDTVIIMLFASIWRQEFWNERASEQGAHGVITKSIDNDIFAGEAQRMVSTRGR